MPSFGVVKFNVLSNSFIYLDSSKIKQ